MSRPSATFGGPPLSTGWRGSKPRTTLDGCPPSWPSCVVSDCSSSTRSATSRSSRTLPTRQSHRAHRYQPVRHFHLVKLASDALTNVRAASPGTCGIVAAGGSTRHGPTGADCCARGNASRPTLSSRCGTESRTMTPAPRVGCRPGSRKGTAHAAIHRRVGGDAHLTRHRRAPVPHRRIASLIPDLLTLPLRRPLGHVFDAGRDHRAMNDRIEGYSRLLMLVEAGRRHSPIQARRCRPDAHPLQRRRPRALATTTPSQPSGSPQSHAS